MPDPENTDTADGGEKATPAPETYEVTVAGEAKQYTLDELKTLASKSAGADQRFQEAAAAKQEAATALRIQELAKTADEDDGDFRELGRLMGRSEEEIENLIAFRNGQDDDDDDDDGKGSPPPRRASRPEGAPAALSAEDREAIAMGKQVALERMRERIEGEIKEALDNDSVLGENRIKSEAARKALFDTMKAEVTVAVAKGQAPDPSLLAAVLQTMRARAKSLGILEDGSGQPKEDAVAMLERHGIGLGPADSPAVAAVKAGEDLPRVPITDPGYAENLAARALLQGVARRES